jgi:diaminopimelate decarboxylase
LPDSSNGFVFERDYIARDVSGCGAFKFIKIEEVLTRTRLWQQLVPSAQLMFGLSSAQEPAIVRALSEFGIPFCADSRSQLERLTHLNVPSAQLLYTPAFPVADSIAALRLGRPSTITVGSLAGLQLLLGQHSTFEAALGYVPTVHVLIRYGGDTPGQLASAAQPYQDPQKVMNLIRALQSAGASSFGLSALVVNSNGKSEPYAQAGAALISASLKMAGAGVLPTSVHILGGLCDTKTVQRTIQNSPEQYLADLNKTFLAIQREVCRQHSSSPVTLRVDAGQVLLGHVPILSRITNVVGPNGGNPFPFVFIESNSYGDFAGHMYGGAAVDVEAVQDPSVNAALGKETAPFIVQGGSCDSVDVINDVRTGAPAVFNLPRNIKTGCYLALHGPRIDNGGMDFNLIPTAKVVVVEPPAAALNQTPDKEPIPFCEYAQNLRGEWAKSQDAQSVRTFVADFVKAKGSSAGISSEVERRDRIKEAAAAALKEFPDLKVPVVLLDLGEYVGRVRQVETFLRWLPRFKSEEDFNKWKQAGCPRSPTPTGVDRLFIPLKTFNDPIAIAALSQLGHGYDAASSGEIAVACGAGAALKRDVIVSHPHMTQRTLMDIAERAPWAVTVDCESQLNRLIQAGLSRETVVFVRMKASAASAVNDLGVKFGAPYSFSQKIDGVTPIICKAHAAGFKQLGIAFHVGTQCCDSKSYREALARCNRIAYTLAQSYKISITHFNIGGGFSDERVARAHKTAERKTLAQTGQQVDAFRKAVEQVVSKPVHIIAEPGRVTCAAAAATLIPVVEVCGEMTSIPRIRLGCNHQGVLSGNIHDSAYYELESLDYSADAKTFGGVDVLGVSGEDRDLFAPAPGKAHKITTATKAGDWVVSFESGAAYGVNAAGALNGIDPGGVIAFYRDPQRPSGFRFIKSPFFDTEGLKNRALFLPTK